MSKKDEKKDVALTIADGNAITEIEKPEAEVSLAAVLEKLQAAANEKESQGLDEGQQKEYDELTKRIPELEEELRTARARVRELEAILRDGVKNKNKAIFALSKIAAQFGLDAEKDLGLKQTSIRTSYRSKSTKKVDAELFVDGKAITHERANTLSYASWVSTKDCGGSNQDGRMTTGEFVSYLKKELKADIDETSSFELELPNKRVVKRVVKAADEKADNKA